MVKVSVIIPCYNAEQRIKEALDSVLNQNLKEIEIICIDDGSTDNTLNILKEYAKKDNRVKIFTQANQYAGVARNKGISEAIGKYLYFMDADDFLVPDALEKVFHKSEEDKADVCLFGAGTLNLATGEQEYTYPLRANIPRTIPFSAERLSDKVLAIHHVAPWNRIYRKSFIDACGIKFQPLQRSNDLFFCLATLIEAKRITVVNECLYIRTTNSGTSLVETMDENPYPFYHANKQLRDYLVENELYETFKERLLKMYLDSSSHVLSKLKDVEKFREVALFLKETYFIEFDIWENRDLLPKNHRHLRNMTFLMETPKEEFGNIIFNPESKLIEKNIKVSVIIPCYNAERFLRECLDSILNQTLKEIEVICIDDGSTDSTIEILKEYVEKDERFNFLTQENQFAGVARNRGLEIAKGKYLSFLDADDLFEPIMLEVMYNKSEEDMADICIGAGGKYDLREKRITSNYKLQYSLLPSKVPFSSEDVYKNIFSVGYTPSWNKLYKRTFIESNGLKFQEIARSNDVLFTQSAISIAQRITVADGWLFHYRVGSETSLVETMDKNPLCFYDSYSALQKFLIRQDLYDNDDVRKGFKKAALASGLYAWRMTKTKAGWLQIALFLKNTYISELELLEVRWQMPPSHKREIAFLLENTDEKLGVYEPILRESESIELSTGFENDPIVTNPESTGTKVSVIVEPSASNEYVRQCLSSICAQTLKEMEIICISDSSIDGLQEVLEDFAEVDTRIVILSDTEKELSTLKNDALAIAKGKYIIFVNGNDLLLKFSLENLYRIAEFNNLDHLFFEGTVFYETIALYHKYKNRDRYEYKMSDTENVMTGKELFESLTRKNKLKMSNYMNFFRLDALRENDISFLTGIREDKIFTLKALNFANRTMIHTESLYLKRISAIADYQLLNGFDAIYEAHQNLTAFEKLCEHLESSTQLEKVEMQLKKELQRAFMQLRKEEPCIPFTLLQGTTTHLLVNGLLNHNIQERYLLHLEKTLAIQSKPEQLQDENAFSSWLHALKEALVYIDDLIILESKLDQHSKNLLLNIKRTGLIQSYPEIYRKDFDEKKKDVFVYDLNNELISKLSTLIATINTLTPKADGLKISGMFENLVFDYDHFDFYFENGENVQIPVDLTKKVALQKKFMDVTLAEHYTFTCDVPKSFWDKRVYLIVKSKAHPTIAKKVRLHFEGIHTLLSNDEGSHFNFGNEIIYYDNDRKTLFITSNEKITEYLRKTDAVIKSETKASFWNQHAIQEWYPHLIEQHHGKRIRLFMDRVYKADDHAEVLFKYFEKHKSSQDENYFVIHKSSDDYKRLKLEGLNVVAYRSFQHLKLLLLADRIITTRPSIEVMSPFKNEYGEKLKNLFKFNLTFVPSGRIKIDTFSKLRFLKYGIENMMISSQEELKNLTQTHQLELNAFVTGLPRFDNLEKSKGKTIVVAPSWYLKDVDNKRQRYLFKEKKEFTNTSYFKKWNSLLNHPELIKACEEYGYEIVFAPHPEIRNSAHRFETEHVRVTEFSDRYQDIINEATCLITDESSIHNDFAYAEKQVFYYQTHDFIKDDSFDYEKEGFGSVLEDEFSLIDGVINNMKNGFKVDATYIERKNSYFAFTDQNNCQRVYDAIKGLDNKKPIEVIEPTVPASRPLLVRIKSKIKRMLKK